MAYDETLAQRIRQLLDGPDIEERKMFGGLAFLVSGRMCCGVQGSDLMVRVPLDQFDSALRRPHVRPMDFTGRPLKGFVYVGPLGLRSPAALRTWIELGSAVAKQPPTASSGRPARRRGRRA